MNFKDLTNANISRAQQTAASMQSFREYLDSFKNKILRWSSLQPDDADYSTATMTITVHDDDKGDCLGVVTAEQYNNAVEGTVDTVDVKLNDAGDTVTITSDELVNNIEDIANEASIQSTFISECLDNSEVKVDSFITKVRNNNSAISGVKIEEYSALLKSGDPVESLKSLFSTVRLAQTSKTAIGENEYLTIASANNFTGANILMVAWNNLWGTISSFFDIAWEGITKIGEFLGKIFDGLINCVKWLVKLVMKPLTTRFEKGNASIGIMDLPLAQFQLCSVTKTSNYYKWDSYAPWLNTMISNWEDTSWFSNADQLRAYPINENGVSLAANKTLTAQRGTDDGRFTMYMKMLLSACIEFVDGVGYYRSYDVVIPSCNGYFDMIARIGVTNTNGVDYLTVQLYSMLPYSSITSLSDSEIYTALQNTCTGIYRTICSQFPAQWSSPASIDIINNWLTHNSDGDNVDIVAHNYVFDRYTMNPSTLTPTPSSVKALDGFWCNFLLNGLLPYLCVMGPSYQYAIDNYDPADPTTPYYSVKSDLLRFFLCDASDYNHTSGDADVRYYNSWDSSLDIVDYRPYVQYNLYGVSTHYQSLDEAANELLKYIIVIVIAAAAVFIAVKWNKFKKKRAALAEIRQGYVDNMSWNLPQNPTKEQLKEYNKAKKKAIKTNKLNGILGIGSSTDSSNSLMSSIFSVRDQLLATQGIDTDNPSVNPPSANLLDIKRLIKS